MIAAGFAVVAWVYAALSDGWPPRKTLALALVSLWGFRLAAHIWWRGRGMAEDYRYREMRDRHGERFWPQACSAHVEDQVPSRGPAQREDRRAQQGGFPNRA